jgi:hypothetical protein
MVAGSHSFIIGIERGLQKDKQLVLSTYLLSYLLISHITHQEAVLHLFRPCVEAKRYMYLNF